jgi:hypothetical protein
MNKVLKTVGLISGLAVALGIDIAVLIGLLPISSAVFVGVVITVIVSATKPSGLKAPAHSYVGYFKAAPASRAAAIGENYVITGKSIHNNSCKFE